MDSVKSSSRAIAIVWGPRISHVISKLDLRNHVFFVVFYQLARDKALITCVSLTARSIHSMIQGLRQASENRAWGVFVLEGSAGLMLNYENTKEYDR